MSPNALLVTGGAGFIGSNLVRELLQCEYVSGLPIVVLDDLSGGSLSNLPDHDRLVIAIGSITDHSFVESLFEKYRFVYIWHLAAYAAEGLSHFVRRFNYTNNVIGSINLINCAIKGKTKRFIFTSSIAVYGNGQVPLTEDMIPAPEDPYGIAKYSVELDLHAAYRMFGLEFTIFRPHNVYGERQNICDPYRNVVGIFMRKLMHGQPLPVFGDGTQQRAFTYIKDILYPMVMAPFFETAKNQTFNVGANVPTTVNDLAGIVSFEFGVDTSIQHLPARDEVAIAFSSHVKCDEVFGSMPVTELTEGVSLMAAFVRADSTRQSASLPKLEVIDNLPASWKPGRR
jgi:UDP-glucose 4-epimerase